MKAHKKARPSNCSHGCHNADHCIHRNEFRNATRSVASDRDVEMIKFPLQLNYVFPNMPKMMRKRLGIRRVGERLVLNDD